MKLNDESLDFAISLDDQDALKKFRNDFLIKDPELLYVDGNSLGRLPSRAIKLSQEIIEYQWGERLIRGWAEGWISSPERVGEKIARIVGADPEEIIVADSTSINLFKLAAAGLKYLPDRKEILTDDLNFPSDIYVLQGTVGLLGNKHQFGILPSEDGIHGPEEKLIEHISSNTALVTLSHVVFKSGFLYNMEKISTAARDLGALTLWDLSHSAGVVPIDLHKSGADMAVGCCYKYLNGGPGAPAFLFVRKEIQEKIFNPIQGWMGSQRMFDFSLDYVPAEGIQRFLTGTPSVLSLSLIEPGVDIIINAGIDQIRKKSKAQIDYLIHLFSIKLKPLGFSLKSPEIPDFRGSHISISHPEGLRINKALIEEMNVIPDFRAPDNIRLGIAPLYTKYQDLFEVVNRIEDVVSNQRYKRYSNHLPKVT